MSDHDIIQATKMEKEGSSGGIHTTSTIMGSLTSARNAYCTSKHAFWVLNLSSVKEIRPKLEIDIIEGHK